MRLVCGDIDFTDHIDQIENGALVSPKMAIEP
jgi:hypothetical protein